MLEVLRRTRVAAKHSAPVLITGETGTGKDCVARMVHQLGPRAHQAFVPVNCGALQGSLTAAELLGHTRGAFTGATEARGGLFRAANHGTLFLDELADLNAAGQATLLRVLDDGEVRPVGSTRAERVDVRVVAASNKNLQREVEAGRFREDLLYRLRQVRIDLPPVRSRGADVALLVRYWFERLRTARPDVLRIDAAAMAALQRYGWPGNVREIRGAIEHALSASRSSVIEVDDIPPEILVNAAEASWGDRKDVPHALELAAGDRERAAKLLGVSRATLYRRMAEAGLTTQPREKRSVSQSHHGLDVETDRIGRRRAAVLRALELAGGDRELAAKLLGVSRATLYRRMAEAGLTRLSSGSPAKATTRRVPA